MTLAEFKAWCTMAYNVGLHLSPQQDNPEGNDGLLAKAVVVTIVQHDYFSAVEVDYYPGGGFKPLPSFAKTFNPDQIEQAIAHVNRLLEFESDRTEENYRRLFDGDLGLVAEPELHGNTCSRCGKRWSEHRRRNNHLWSGYSESEPCYP